MQTAEDIDQSLPKPKKSRKGIGGRPSKYNPALISKARQYLDNYEQTGDEVPTLAGLAQEIDLSRETVHKWSNDRSKKEFSDIVRSIAYAQERKLINAGLTGKYNSVITKLLLGKHGYTENSDKNQGNSGITVQVNRGSVKLKSGGQELEIDTTEDTGRTIEHKP